MGTTASATRGYTFSPGEEMTSANLNAAGVPTISVNETNVGISGGTITGTLITLPSYATASLPSGSTGQIVYCTDGDGGDPCLATYNGSDWLRVVLGAACNPLH
jgi:hypothetical protein